MTDAARFAFSPPAIAPPAGMRWLLGRAFGPQRLTAEPPPDPGEAWELARTFNLAPRIAARTPARDLETELGAEVAERFRHAHRTVVAATLAYERLAAEVAETAAARSLPILWLKGFALHLAGVAPAGARPFGDLDLLAPAADAGELHAALVATGYRALDAPANERHLPPLAAPRFGSVDLHYRLTGLEVGGGDATLEALDAAGLCRPLDGFAGRCLAPGRPLLAAHLVVHGLRQHANRPATYPLFRLVADLADLLPAPADWRELRRQALPWLERRVGTAEIDALEGLCACLAAGELPADGGAETGNAGLLLRHVLAAQLDPTYREWLGARHAAARLEEARREGRLLPYLGRKLLAADADVDLRYGRPASRWGYLGRKLARPFHLGWRLLRAALVRRQSPYQD